MSKTCRTSKLCCAVIVFLQAATRVEPYSVDDGVMDSPACLGGDTGGERGFVRLIRCLGLDKGKQALVLLGGSKELEGDAASAHGTDHRGHFKREFTFTNRQLQIEDVVRMDLGLALDDTAAHREIEHRSLTTDLAPGEREIESHGNPEVFAAIDRMRGMVQPKMRR